MLWRECSNPMCLCLRTHLCMHGVRGCPCCFEDVVLRSHHSIMFCMVVAVMMLPCCR